jgi:nucleoside-diphosphate-sugar epimerase
MTTALIGFTGYVGTTLARQRPFDDLFRSTNIADIRGRNYDLVVCSGAPAQKWIANREPEADRKNIEALIGHLDTIECNHFVLISTVDVFMHAVGINERSSVEESGLHPYGTHRRMLEKFVEARFLNHLIVRLAGLVGPGLRKNVIYDFLNNNNLHAIESRGVYQFYPMVNLWDDLTTAMRQGLKLAHLTAEPISVAEVAREGFGLTFEHVLNTPPARYDMQTVHASLFGGSGNYQYTRRECIQAIRHYAQSEQPKVAGTGVVRS